MTPHEHSFRQLCRNLLRRGIKPTPTILNIYLGRYLPDTWGHPEEQGMSTRNRPNHINGRETAWRRDELQAAGWIGGGGPGHPDTNWRLPNG